MKKSTVEHFRTQMRPHRKHWLFAFTLLLFVSFTAAAVEQPSSNSRATDRLRDQVRYLASDELTGRGVGTPGIELARDYIAAEFKNYGLLPGGADGSFLQPF